VPDPDIVEIRRIAPSQRIHPDKDPVGRKAPGAFPGTGQGGRSPLAPWCLWARLPGLGCRKAITTIPLRHLLHESAVQRSRSRVSS